MKRKNTLTYKIFSKRKYYRILYKRSWIRFYSRAVTKQLAIQNRIEYVYLSFFRETIIQMLTMHGKKWYQYPVMTIYYYNSITVYIIAPKSRQNVFIFGADFIEFQPGN